MSSFNDEKILKEAFDMLRLYAPEYAWLHANPEKTKSVKESARAVALEQFQLSKVLGGQSLVSIDNLLSQHLSPRRMTMLRQGFDLETTHGTLSALEMSRESGKKLEPSNTPSQAESQSIELAISKLYASILFDVFGLLSSLAGAKVSFKDYVGKALNKTARSINSSSKLQKALEEFRKAWNEAGENIFKKATALFNLIKDGGILDAFKTIFEGKDSNKDRYDWLKTALLVIAITIAAIATDGIALIAEIALIISDAKDLAQKIKKLNELEMKRSKFD